MVEGRYPQVYGGVINLISQDYLTNYYPVDTYTIEDSTVLGYAVAGVPTKVIEMHRIKPINLSFKKMPIGKCILPLECSYTTSGPLEFSGLSTLSPLPYKDISCEQGKKQCFFPSGNSLFELDEL